MDEGSKKLEFIFVFGGFDSYGNNTNITKIAQIFNIVKIGKGAESLEGCGRG